MKVKGNNLNGVVEMPKLNVYKSEGETVYLCGLRVWKSADGIIRLAYDRGDKKGKKNDITHCENGSDVEKFFSRLLKTGA
jgi:hypothetical protein